MFFQPTHMAPTGFGSMDRLEKHVALHAMLQLLAQKFFLQQLLCLDHKVDIMVASLESCH